MGQKSNPNSLRLLNSCYKGYSYWDNSAFNYIIQNIEKMLAACCRNTNVYLNDNNIVLSHDLIFIEMNILHFYNSRRNIVSKRFTSNKLKQNSNVVLSWNLVLRRLYFCTTLMLKFTGLKRVNIKINRTIVHSRVLPKTVRQKTSFYIKRYNRAKYDYARIGIKLLFLTLKNKTSVKTLINFIRKNIRTRSRRKKHMDFLKFLKHCFDNLDRNKIIKGIKLQIRGRFGHKPKGRSKTWKYQLGTMPLNKLNASIYYNYDQAQTKLGSVGIKAWIYAQ